MFELSHTTEECAGRWQRDEDGGRVAWRCSGCRAEYHDGVAVRFAVLREYDLELVIGRLVREGRRLLSAPPGESHGALPPEEAP